MYLEPKRVHTLAGGMTSSKGAPCHHESIPEPPKAQLQPEQPDHFGTKNAGHRINQHPMMNRIHDRLKPLGIMDEVLFVVVDGMDGYEQ